MIPRDVCRTPGIVKGRCVNFVCTASMTAEAASNASSSPALRSPQTTLAASRCAPALEHASAPSASVVSLDVSHRMRARRPGRATLAGRAPCSMSCARPHRASMAARTIVAARGDLAPSINVSKLAIILSSSSRGASSAASIARGASWATEPACSGDARALIATEREASSAATITRGASWATEPACSVARALIGTKCALICSAF
mmetsp:Transcript_1816/g.6683  ORF Transcript_1816/g.6683 Transcript_1816/m.6683 type:complete len:204 (-) Transcript_1816:4-615(-)